MDSRSRSAKRKRSAKPDSERTPSPSRLRSSSPATPPTRTRKASAGSGPSAASPRSQLGSLQLGDPLERELASKNDLLETQRSLMSDMYQQCTCTICLELLWRPFILAPCGHIFCAGCLVSWFKQPLDREDALPSGLSAEERSAEEKRRTLKRKKICPACRTELACAPVEVWLIKGMLEKVESFASSSSDGAALDLPALEAAKRKAEALPPGAKVWEGIFDGRGPRRILHDAEDGVRRCGECASEIWDGLCTNPACGIEYSETDSDYGSERGVQIYDLDSAESEPSDDFSGSEMADFIEQDREEDEDGFIRGPRRGFGDEPIIVTDSDSDTDSVNDETRRARQGWAGESDDDDLPRPVRAPNSGVVELSDSEDDTEEEYGSRPARRPGARIVDESDEEDAGSDESDSDRDEEGYETADSVHRQRTRAQRGRIVVSDDSDDGILAPEDSDDDDEM